MGLKKLRRFEEKFTVLKIFQEESRRFEEENENRGESRSFEELWQPCITSRVKSAWKKFRELLPILTNKSIPVKCRSRVFSSAVRGVMWHVSTTWAVTVDDCNRLIRNDNAMIRWICFNTSVRKGFYGCA